MALRLEEKQAMAAEVNTVAAAAHSAVTAEYRGLSVAEMDALRVSARKSGVYLRVVKNTVAKRAVTGTDFECLKETLRGPLLLAFSQEDPGAAARVVRDFAKDHQHLIAKTLALGGELLPAGELDRLANLPSREEAIGMLMALMQAPIGRLARTLAEPQAKLARTFAALRDQKQAA
jgi:large subunit ribosomal protein L10